MAASLLTIKAINCSVRYVPLYCVRTDRSV